MSRIWKEKSDLPLSKEDRLRYKLEPSLDLGWLYFVEVYGFTFKFRSWIEIQKYADFYSQKILPSSRTSDKTFNGDHWERQTRFDELPLYLRAASKRHKVVQALLQAQAMFSRE